MSIYRIKTKQHIGAPCKPTVSVNDQVKRGQVIGIPEGLGGIIHSSVNGVVKEISEDSIYIEGEVGNPDEYVRLEKKDSIADMAYDAGIVGSGGAGFPAHIKLKTEIEDGYLIANCVECEPLLEHNIKSIEKDPSYLIKGLKYAMEATKAPKGYIAIKAKNEKAIAVLEEAIKNEANIEIKALRDMYPMGEERAIIHEILGIWLEPEQLPVEARCVVMNEETLENLAKAVDELKPVIDKDISVAGNLKSGKESNIFFQVPIGTRMEDLIEESGGINGKYGEIVIGGPYTGKADSIEDAVVTKVSGGCIVTIELPDYEGPIGLLVCACGANEDRLRDIASKMNSQVVGVTKCKNAIDVRGTDKCLTPGHCPGQVQGIMQLKSQGAERVLISNCSDCSNTVMCCAPQMGLGVYHHTDHIFRTVDHELTRRLAMEE